MPVKIGWFLYAWSLVTLFVGIYGVLLNKPNKNQFVYDTLISRFSVISLVFIVFAFHMNIEFQ